MKKQKDFTVILLMAVGIIFITLAGGIFISSTWKVLPEALKQVILILVTGLIFTGSFYAEGKKKLSITSRALYYLGVVSSGFTSYMILGFLENYSFNTWESYELRFFISNAIVLLEMIYAYYRKKHASDYVIIYIFSSTLLISLTRGFYWSYEVYGILTAFFALLLCINAAYLHGRSDASNTVKKCASVLMVTRLITASITLLINMTDSSENLYSTHAAVIIFAGTLIYLMYRKNNFARCLSSGALGLMLLAINDNVVFDFVLIENYYVQDFSFILIAVFVVLMRIIWYDRDNKSTGCEVLTFVISVFAYAGLLVHNFEEIHIECVLTLGISAVALLIYASIIGHKKFQVLSGVVLSIMAIYLTREFWLNIAWWVYLLIAGIICITVAVLKEKKNEEERADDISLSSVKIEVIDYGENE